MMDRNSASRIQRAACKQNNGATPKNSFAARAMSAAYRNQPTNRSNENSLASMCCKAGLFAAATAATAASIYLYYSNKLTPR